MHRASVAGITIFAILREGMNIYRLVSENDSPLHDEERVDV